MFIFLAEGSTPFLNITWLLHQLHLQHSVPYKLGIYLLASSFLIFRVILGPVAIVHLLMYSQYWGSSHLDRSMYIGNLIIIVLFTLINFYWFGKLIQIAFKKKKSDKES
jgi:hypothetical protein